MARHPTPLQHQLRSLWAAIDAAGGPASVGPKGDKGDKGDPGETGPAGSDGAPGADGQSGPKGDTGERGETGLQGPVGNDGNDGSNGAPGADGPSAYEVAVSNGFVGTEAQWLASLVGAKGDKGDKGNTGDSGATGLPGSNGSDGNDGMDGPSAYEVAVTNGFVGTQAAWLLSIKGAKGDAGDTGPAGSDANITNATVNTAIEANPGASRTSLQLGSAAQSATSAFTPASHVGSGGSAHANAVASGAAGFLTGTDKAKLDAITGSNTGDQTVTLSGDVSGSGTGAITTAIGAGKVTLAMQANMATASVVYRKTAGAGSPEVQTIATLKADLGLTGSNSGDQTSIVGITGTVAQFNTAVTDADLAIAARNINTTAPLTGGGDLSADRTIAISAATSGAAGSMSAADKSKLDAIASGATANSSDATLLARANHTGTQTLDTTTDSATRLAMTAAERTKLSGIATSATANSSDAVLSAAYRTLLDSSGSHTAARVAGTYGFGQGDPLAITGTGTLYPLNIIQISAADYPAIGALAAKLRVKATINCNDVAPGHNFVLGLHPVTRPATSGGAGLCIYTIGAAVSGSTVTATTPAADSSAAFTSADFALPADGQYVLGVITNGATATSAHVHLSAALQLHHA